MDPLLLPALWIGAPLALLLVYGRGSRRLHWAGFCAILGLCAAFYFDVLHFSSTLFGADWEPVWVLLAWIEFGVIARWAGGFPVRGPLGPLALVGGAILGDIGASVLLAPRAATPLQKARVALTASAGAMLSPIGTPVTLLLVDPAAFGLLPIALAAISWPRGWAQDQVDDTLLPLTQTGANRNLLILVVVVLASFAGFSLFWVLGIGCVALMLPLLKKGIRPPTPWGKEAWIVVLAILCFLSVASGAFREAQMGLQQWVVLGTEWTAPLLAAGGTVLSVLGTEEGAALLANQVQNVGYSDLGSTTWAVLGAGIAVGGIGPLIVAGAFRAGLWIWAAQWCLVLIWATTQA